jgi:hypothetical protein
MITREGRIGNRRQPFEFVWCLRTLWEKCQLLRQQSALYPLRSYRHQKNLNGCLLFPLLPSLIITKGSAVAVTIGRGRACLRGRLNHLEIHFENKYILVDPCTPTAHIFLASAQSRSLIKSLALTRPCVSAVSASSGSIFILDT